MLQEFAQDRAQAALAFPDDKNHRRLIEAIAAALAALEIKVYFIDEQRIVHEFTQSHTS